MVNSFVFFRRLRTGLSLALILAQISSSAFAFDFAERPGSAESAPEIIHQNIVEPSLGEGLGGANLEEPFIEKESLKEDSVLKMRESNALPRVKKVSLERGVQSTANAPLNRKIWNLGRTASSAPVLFANSNQRLKERSRKIARQVKSVLKAWGKPAESISPAGKNEGEISSLVLSLPRGNGSQQLYAPLNQKRELIKNAAPPTEPPSAASFGLKQILFSVGVGCLMLSWWGVTTFLALHMGYVPHSNYQIPQISVGSAFWMGFFGPIIEELGFRVGMFDGLRWAMVKGGKINPRKALVIATIVGSVIFTALHETADPVYFMIRLASSLLFIFAYRKAGWAGSSLAHMTNNLGFLASKSGMTLAPWIFLIAVLGSVVWGLLVWLKILPASAEGKSLFWGSAWEWLAARRSKSIK